MSPRLERLAELLACPACGAATWRVAGDDENGGLTCLTCQATYPCARGVLDLGDQQQDDAVAQERAAVYATESNPTLGGINAAFEDLSRAEGELKEAILALPYGNDSAFYREPGYFQNVRASVAGFEFLMANLDLRPGRRLLDLGADLTWATSVIARQGLDCTAVDINHHLAVGRLFGERYGSPYHLVRADMRRASFRPDTFDVVLAMNALHHPPDLDLVAANIARILRPGGQLGLIEPYISSEAAREDFGRAQIEAGIHEQTYRLDEWHDAFSRAGLEVQAVRVCDSFGAVYRKAAGPAETRVPGMAGLFDGFYAGGVSLAEAGRRIVTPGERFSIPITIRNDGSGVWCSNSQFPVCASYHLYAVDRDTQHLVSFDNVRSQLPVELRSGGQVTMPLEVRAPDRAGDYLVQVDLVHEHVSWFAQRRFASASASFRVEGL